MPEMLQARWGGSSTTGETHWGSIVKSIVAIAFALLVLWSSPSWGQDRCIPFRGTINAGVVLFQPLSNPVVSGWAGVASFSFDNREATTKTINTGVQKGGPGTDSNVTIGTELTTVSFDSSDGFLLFTHFVGVHGEEGRVNETGTIAPIPGNTGKYANVHGHFTSHGPFGPSVQVPDGYPFGNVPLNIYWFSDYHGEICGIN